MKDIANYTKNFDYTWPDVKICDASRVLTENTNLDHLYCYKDYTLRGNLGSPCTISLHLDLKGPNSGTHANPRKSNCTMNYRIKQFV